MRVSDMNKKKTSIHLGWMNSEDLVVSSFINNTYRNKCVWVQIFKNRATNVASGTFILSKGLLPISYCVSSSTLYFNNGATSALFIYLTLQPIQLSLVSAGKWSVQYLLRRLNASV